MLGNVNKFIKKHIEKLTPRGRKEVLSFAAFLRKQEKEVQ